MLYDQITLIADVVKRGAKDAQSIRDGLAATRNFSGVTGSAEFDKTNQNTKMDTVHYMEDPARSVVEGAEVELTVR